MNNIDQNTDTGHKSATNTFYAVLVLALFIAWVIGYALSELNMIGILGDCIAHFVNVLSCIIIHHLSMLSMFSLLLCFLWLYLWDSSSTIKPRYLSLFVIFFFSHLGMETLAYSPLDFYKVSAYLFLVGAWVFSFYRSTKFPFPCTAHKGEFCLLNTGAFKSRDSDLRVSVRYADGSIKWLVLAAELDWRMDIDNPITSYTVSLSDPRSTNDATESSD